MRVTKYFLPILKENPVDAKIVSHRLMLRAGMIRQLSSGLYSWLPLGFKVLKNIENIVRKYMNLAGAIEVLMPCIQPAELWLESGRYDDYGKEMLRITDRHEHSLLFGPTNEEAITDIFRNDIKSYKELPKNFYHIQWKFRDEIRPRFGVMRGREFLMKDAYSFDLDEASAKISYDNMFDAYLKSFKAMGLHVVPVRAVTGAIGGNLSHEFHVITKNGESQVYYDPQIDTIVKHKQIDIQKLQTLYAAADEKHDPSMCPLTDTTLKVAQGSEVGHIFYFGTKYSKAMNTMITNKEGQQVYPEMGSYGIGISRLVAAIIEASHDDSGIIWPASVAPFTVSLINLNVKDATSSDLGEKLYEQLQKAGIEVLYDDSANSVGSKFATHDLIGSPWQVIVGPRLAKDGLVELKNRKTGATEQLSSESAMAKLIAEIV